MPAACSSPEAPGWILVFSTQPRAAAPGHSAYVGIREQCSPVQGPRRGQKPELCKSGREGLFGADDTFWGQDLELTLRGHSCSPCPVGAAPSSWASSDRIGHLTRSRVGRIYHHVRSHSFLSYQFILSLFSLGVLLLCSHSQDALPEVGYAGEGKHTASSVPFPSLPPPSP